MEFERYQQTIPRYLILPLLPLIRAQSLQVHVEGVDDVLHHLVGLVCGQIIEFSIELVQLEAANKEVRVARPLQDGLVDLVLSFLAHAFLKPQSASLVLLLFSISFVVTTEDLLDALLGVNDGGR